MAEPISVVKSGVSVTTDYTEIFSQNLGGQFDKLAIELTNTGDTNALSDVKIQLQQASGAAFGDRYGGADFLDPAIVEYCDTTVPNTLAAANTISNFTVLLEGAWAVKLLAKVAANTTTVTARATIS
jgi:hypothetical protein